MKKIIGLFALLACLSTELFAQSVQFQTGITFSRLNWEIDGKPSIHYDEPTAHFNFFLGLNYLERKSWFLSSNIGYIRKGGANRVYARMADGTMRYIALYAELDYVSLNTTFNYQLNLKHEFYPFFSIGPRLDFVVNGHGGLADWKNTDTKAVNYGAILGLGIRKKVKQFSIGIRTDYYLNAIPIAKWDAAVYDTHFRLKGRIQDYTGTFNLSLAYHFKN